MKNNIKTLKLAEQVAAFMNESIDEAVEKELDPATIAIAKNFKKYNNKSPWTYISDEIEDKDRDGDYHVWLKFPKGEIVYMQTYDGESVDFYLVDKKNDMMVKVGTGWLGGDFEYEFRPDEVWTSIPDDMPKDA